MKSTFVMLKSEIDYKEENNYETRSADHINAAEWNLLSVPKKETEEHPYQSAIVKLSPMQYHDAPVKATPPNGSLSVDWIYGYQSEKSRSNVRYNYEGNVVYHISKYAIVYNFAAHTQKIFTGHIDEITCLAMHPEGKLCATGDIGPKPRLIVWHTHTREIVFLSRTFHRNGVSHAAFSIDGKLLAAVGNDSNHSLSVHRWADNIILFTSRVDRGQCLCLAFLQDSTVAIGGDTFLFLWTQSAEGYEKRKANYSSLTPEQPITCIVAVNGASRDSAIAGTAGGKLSLWVDRNCVSHLRAHTGTVNCLYGTSHGVISGGMDRRVRLWTSNLECSASFDLSSFGIFPSIRSVCCSLDGQIILFGTKGGSIYEISTIDGSDVRGGSITSGQSSGNIRALSFHPSRTEFVTAGDDMRLRIWDANTHTLLRIGNFDAEIRAAVYSPLGDFICIGLGASIETKNTQNLDGENSEKIGSFLVISEIDFRVVFEGKDSVSAVCAVQYSPLGDTLAVGVEDGSIFLYAVQDNYEFVGKCVLHNSPVTHVDFSLDGEWMRSNSQDRALGLWSTDDASLQSNLSTMRDVEWAKATCPYIWHTKDIHASVYKVSGCVE